MNVLNNSRLINDQLELKEYDNKYVVYLLVFPNDKIYCGYSSKISRRWKNANEYKNQLVHKAIQKYGWENIKKYIYFVSDNKENALQTEKEVIENLNLLNPDKGYNIVEGGGDPPHGLQCVSEDGYKRMQANGKRLANEVWGDPEKAAYVIQRMKEETHKKRMEMTPEQRKKSFGEHNIGNKAPNAKKIYQLDKDTEEIIAIYDSSRFAAKALGNEKYANNIRSVACGNKKTAYCYKWRWAE